MNYWVVIAGIFIIFLGFTYYRGDRKLNEMKKVEAMVNEKAGNVKAGEVTLQGGFPPIPRPANVTVGVSDNYAVVYDFKGTYGMIDFDKVKNVEKFTTRKKADLKGRSVVMWGPFVPFIFRAKIQHFIIMNYIDVNNEKNNIVFASKDATQINNVYEQLDKSWHQYKEHK